jgi:hypothetical protein
MKLTSRFLVLASLASGLCFAGSWSGALVDAECYATALHNFSQGHPGSTNTKRAVESCFPTEKTTSFSVVQQVGMTLTLDTAGNEMARKLFLKEGKKSPFLVSVVGDRTDDTVKVSTISVTK